MRRLTPFERDFEDLHGPGFRPRVIHDEIVREAPKMRRSVRIGVGAGLAAISLFWILVLGAMAAGMAAAIFAFGWALVFG